MGKNNVVEELIKEGKSQGYLTYKKIEKCLADDIINIEKIEYLYDVLSESGVDLVETEEEGHSLIKDKEAEEKDRLINLTQKELDLEAILSKELEIG